MASSSSCSVGVVGIGGAPIEGVAAHGGASIGRVAPTVIVASTGTVAPTATVAKVEIVKVAKCSKRSKRSKSS